MLFDKKIVRKNSPKKRMHFDKSSPKKRNQQQQKKIPQRNEKNSPIVRQTAQLATLSQN